MTILLTATHIQDNQLNRQRFWIKAVMQFTEGLTDKQAAQAVAARRFPIRIRFEIERDQF